MDEYNQNVYVNLLNINGKKIAKAGVSADIFGCATQIAQIVAQKNVKISKLMIEYIDFKRDNALEKSVE